MSSHAGNSRKYFSISKVRICVIIVLYFILLLTPFSCRKHPENTKPSPPDLSQCTKIEVQYLPSTLEYFFQTEKKRVNLLNSEEVEYLSHLRDISSENQGHLKEFASSIKSGKYLYTSLGTPRIFNYIRLLCYSNNELCASLIIIGDRLKTQDNYYFEFNSWDAIDKLTPQIVPFQFRLECNRSLSELAQNFHNIKRYYEKTGNNLWPKAFDWCDNFVERYRSSFYIEDGKRRNRYDNDEEFLAFFRCPSICTCAMNPYKDPNTPCQRICHYAMNINCEVDSPSDTVLLFETKAGWNQYGGPELFTFDNHDPHGGCVLLNDGTVRFIRTEEELQQLRWK
jgi:hypothetical protein